MAIEIWTAEDLYNVRNDLGASYIQMADIDLSSYSNWAPIGSPTGCFSDGSFSGTYDGNNFKITNLTINDPTGTKESNGLFSPLTGILKNIILEDVNVVGAKNIGALAGRANCVSFGATTLIENCHVISGSVSGNKNVGGLIGNSSLWYGEGLGNNHIKVLKCSVNCSIRGGKSIGGIIGKCSGAEDTAPGSLPSNVQIILCSSNVSITMFQLDLSEYYGSNTPNIGGIVGGFTYWRDNLGSIFGLIQDCFSFCSVDVSSEVTFLDGCGFNIGSILGGAGNRIKIENCYGVPNFNINYSLDPNDGSTINTVGGLFGGHTSLDAPIIISSSYYNSEEYAPNIDNGYGTAKTTTELKEEALFEDWISSGRWLMEPEINDGYPYLNMDFIFADGTEQFPFQIYTVTELINITNNLSACYKQMANIDLNSIASWTPIGSSLEPFTGMYDGGVYAINNLHLGTAGLDLTYGGLFGVAEDPAIFKNITLINPTISGLKLSLTGSICGYYKNGSAKVAFYNCTIFDLTINCSSTSSFGFMAGVVEDINISHCYVKGIITGAATESLTNIGGIIGDFYNTLGNNYSINGCISDIRIKAGYIFVGGGIIGQHNDFSATGTLEIKNCYAAFIVTTKVSGGYHAGVEMCGGIIGMFYPNGGADKNINIYNCHTTFSISQEAASPYTGTKYYYAGDCGGISGYCDNISLLRCSAKFNILYSYRYSGLDYELYEIGGLIGYQYGRNTISERNIEECVCFFYMEDSSASYIDRIYIGGLVGSLYNQNNLTTVSNCYCVGNIFGDERIGGLVGVGRNLKINNCYASSSLSGTSLIGPILGEVYINQPTINNVFYNQTIVGVPDNGYGVGIEESLLKEEGTFTSWDFSETWRITEEMENGLPSLQEEIKEIWTAEDLYNVRYSTSANHIQMADIDLSQYNWRPICDDKSYYYNFAYDLSCENGYHNSLSCFSGSYNGNNFKISNLCSSNIDSFDSESSSFSDGLALFGTIHGEGTSIKNVIIENARMELTDETNDFRYVGILALQVIKLKEIINCEIRNSTIITSSVNRGGSFMVHSLSDCDVKNCIIKNCNISILGDQSYFTFGFLCDEGYGVLAENCSVNGVLTTEAPIRYSGGLMGGIYNSWDRHSTIKECSADISIESQNIQLEVIGSFAGFVTASTSIEDCYATGKIECSEDGFIISGFIGECGQSWSDPPEMIGPIIKNCYSAVDIQPLTEYFHPFLVSVDGNPYIENCYYDKELSFESAIPYALPKTTEEMKGSETFTNWNFEDTWVLIKDRNNDYPILQTTFLPIASIEDFYAMGSLDVYTFAQGTEWQITTRGGCHKNYRQMVDIDWSSKTIIEPINSKSEETIVSTALTGDFWLSTAQREIPELRFYTNTNEKSIVFLQAKIQSDNYQEPRADIYYYLDNLKTGERTLLHKGGSTTVNGATGITTITNYQEIYLEPGPYLIKTYIAARTASFIVRDFYGKIFNYCVPFSGIYYGRNKKWINIDAKINDGSSLFSYVKEAIIFDVEIESPRLYVENIPIYESLYYQRKFSFLAENTCGSIRFENIRINNLVYSHNKRSAALFLMDINDYLISPDTNNKIEFINCDITMAMNMSVATFEPINNYNLNFSILFRDCYSVAGDILDIKNCNISCMAYSIEHEDSIVPAYLNLFSYFRTEGGRVVNIENCNIEINWDIGGYPLIGDISSDYEYNEAINIKNCNFYLNVDEADFYDLCIIEYCVGNINAENNNIEVFIGKGIGDRSGSISGFCNNSYSKKIIFINNNINIRMGLSTYEPLNASNIAGAFYTFNLEDPEELSLIKRNKISINGFVKTIANFSWPQVVGLMDRPYCYNMQGDPIISAGIIIEENYITGLIYYEPISSDPHSSLIFSGFIDSIDTNEYTLLIRNNYSKLSIESVGSFPIIKAAGFAEYAYELLDNQSVENCYYAGTITGNVVEANSFIIGHDEVTPNQEKIISCYWDNDICPYGSSYGSPKTTTEMKTKSTFINWNFIDLWAIRKTENDGYPYFASDGPIITVIETLVDFAFPYYYFPVDYSLYEEEPPAPPIEGKNVYSSLIPIYRTASKISQPIIIEGNIGAVRAGKLIAQTIIIPEQTNPGLIRIKNKKGEYTYSLTAPEISGKDAVLTKEVIASVDGVLYVESKYSKIKYAKGLYGMYTKNPPQ